MKRNPRKLRWTKAYRKASGKELAIDTTFSFERRRNRVSKYDRDMVATTLKAMPVIEKIKTQREHDFHKVRMVVREKETRKDALRQLATGLDVLGPLVVREKIAERAKEHERAMEIEQQQQAIQADDGNDES